jgi:muramoyltetrapeptide carboxypeptidase LdcA involved in peptidoglycan recycling
MRNFTIEDFSGAGQYLLRMSREEIYAKENNKKFSGYSDVSYLSTIIRKIVSVLFGIIIKNNL